MRATTAYIIAVIVIASVQIVRAQGVRGTDDVRLVMLARTSADSITLRWGPSTASGWIAANRHGYIIERARLASSGTIDDDGFVNLAPEPIRPWSLETFRQRVTERNPFAAIAAQMLYGKSTGVSDPSDEVGSMRDAANVFQNRFGIALFAADNEAMAAEALGLRFVDHTVRRGDEYVYRVRVAHRGAIGAEDVRFDTAALYARAVESEPAPAPFDARAVGRDRHIEVSWGREAGRSYTGFYIERSEGDGRSWVRLNRTPFMVMSSANGVVERPAYTDTSIVNYRTYRYRVQGVTPFGDLSAAAEVEAFGRDLTPPAAPMQANPKQIGDRAVKVAWKLENPPSDLAGFVVARADSPTSLPRPLHARTLPAETREFVDTIATEDEPYYIVLAVDTAGNVSKSFAGRATIVDTSAPKRPTGLTGTIDSNGVVRLHWNRGTDHHLMGYRILWANDPDHEFSLITPNPVFDTMYVDTVAIQTLSRRVYYRVVAESDRYVRSVPSENLVLTRPDLVAPVAAVIQEVVASESNVTLRFAASSSDDIAVQIIERRGAGDPKWSRIAEVRSGVGRYSDTSVERRLIYEYRVIAIDSVGNRSQPSNVVQGRRYDDGRRAPVGSLEASYDAGKKLVLLRWNHNEAPTETFQYILYRAKEGGPMTQYEGVAGNQRSYEDRVLVGKGRYTYALRVVTDDGGESPMSERVAVVVGEEGR